MRPAVYFARFFSSTSKQLAICNENSDSGCVVKSRTFIVAHDGMGL